MSNPRSPVTASGLGSNSIASRAPKIQSLMPCLAWSPANDTTRRPTYQHVGSMVTAEKLRASLCDRLLGFGCVLDCAIAVGKVPCEEV
jgi:hypothetical protein